MLKMLVGFLFTTVFAATNVTHTVGTPLSAKYIDLEAAVIQQEGDDLSVMGDRRDLWLPELLKSKTEVNIPLKSQAVLVMDVKSGLVMRESNAMEMVSIASLTKLATALVFLKHHPGWDKVITLRQDDVRNGNIAYIKVGEEVTVLDLFYASLVGSDNSATIALARSTGLSSEEFVAEMNLLARSLGLNETVFVEPTGLEVENRSTANELARLAYYAFTTPEIKRAAATPYYRLRTGNTNRQMGIANTNYLLSGVLRLNDYESDNFEILGGKTGHLNEAGYHLATLVTDQEGHEILILVLGATDSLERFTEAKSLMRWVFDSYLWPDIN